MKNSFNVESCDQSHLFIGKLLNDLKNMKLQVINNNYIIYIQNILQIKSVNENVTKIYSQITNGREMSMVDNY